MAKMKGLIAAPFTPMKEEGAVDYDKIELQAELFRRNKLAGVFVCGTTGEGFSLTLAERKKVVEKWAPLCDDSLRLFLHVGNECLEAAKELAAHAQSVGVFATSAIGPVFFRPNQAQLLADWCAAIAGEAPEIPFYYYHIPSKTGLHFNMIDLLPLLEERIANLGGIKYSHENHFDLSRCIRYKNGKYDIFYGMDEILLSGLIAGVQGAVGSFYNICPALVNEIMELFFQGEIARAQALQVKVQELAAIYFKYGGNVGVGKAMLKVGGLDIGPARPPVPNLTEEETLHLKKDLDAIGFEQFVIR